MAASTTQAVPKLYDVILWLMGRVEKFPRSQKFTLGDRIVNISLDILDLLIEATYTRDRLALLRKANVQLEKLRYLIRICHDLKLLSAKQYAYVSNEINEAGKLLGGWIRSQSSSS
ncbi:diversity-generating retroelement protein Avd [Candidatus Poribacteria bacterium]|nr:diversity-generating retroelement protein Avd [Candidatus Poribacteria bacterium]MYH83195.1 diversity-generating retroelement protein Avd [Candidatus Poribacteria bacterium]MYK95001.1 diversity-generating retroelement protein Avd [Candidatus Poribacteria bacterium]